MIELPFESIEESDSYEIPDISRVSGALIERFVRETDLFVFAQIGGPISMVNEMIGMEDYMVYSLTNTEEIRELARKIMVYEVQKAKLFLDSGANGILLADDMAFNTGLFLPPHIMEEIAYPFMKKQFGKSRLTGMFPLSFTQMATSIWRWIGLWSWDSTGSSLFSPQREWIFAR